MATTRQERRSPRADQETLAGPEARQRLIDAMPVTERRIDLEGIPTAVLRAAPGCRSYCCTVRASSRPSGSP